jgi:hypothetical protein
MGQGQVEVDKGGSEVHGPLEVARFTLEDGRDLGSAKATSKDEFGRDVALPSMAVDDR